MRFEPIGSSEQIEHLAKIADEIWHGYWPALIGIQQTDYMVNTFQSYEALCHDIQDKGYVYWFLIDGASGSERVVGYTGGLIEQETQRLFISKIYLHEGERGKGYSSCVIRFFDDLCCLHHIESMYLTVNKNNDIAIRAYKHFGFETTESVETQIGNGFVMDDYIMQRAVAMPTE